VTRVGPNGTSKDEYTYDESGNMRTRKIGGNTQTLEWNAEGLASTRTMCGRVPRQYSSTTAVTHRRTRNT
ncbi:hypothetical protein, partial [Kibdelosporangium persicum]